MVKILIVGHLPPNEVFGEQDAWQVLLSRLQELQRSTQGPFELLFCTGVVFHSLDTFLSVKDQLASLELQIYVFHKPDFLAGQDIPSCLEFVGQDEVGMCNTAKNLTIAYHFPSPNESQKQERIEQVRVMTSSMGYRGCDLLFSSHWPREAHQFLQGQDLVDFLGSNIGVGRGQQDVTNFATLVRPRYHVVGGMKVFYQRPPFVLPGNVDGQCRVFSRLIAMDDISTSKEKSKKWIHALGLNPIIYMKVAEIEEPPAGFTDCPYLQTSSTSSSAGHVRDTSTQPPAKRFKFVEEQAANANNGAFFFGNQGGNGQVKLNLSAENTDCKTLFIGGLGKDSNEQELRQILYNVVNIRRASGKAFCFVEFKDHESAKKVVEGSNRGKVGLVLQGRKLTVGWGNSKPQDGQAADGSRGPGSAQHLEQAMQDRLLIPPSEDSKTLFIGNLPTTLENVESTLLNFFTGSAAVQVLPNKSSYAFVDFDSFDGAMAYITKSINEKIVLEGNPLIIGWSKAKNAKSALLLEPPFPECKVLFVGKIPQEATLSDIEEIFKEYQVVSTRKPEGRDYSFVEFQHADDAHRCMNQLCSQEVMCKEQILQFGWAKGRAADVANESQECWFCLASPTIKVHLIISVGEGNYLALPRGGIMDKHVLICPIDCVPSRIHLSQSTKEEMQKFHHGVESMFEREQCSMLTFERAIRTKGSRDHMQIHAIPIPYKYVNNALQVFMQQSQQHQLKFHELLDDQVVDEVVLNMEGGPYQEYFYVELPVSPSVKKRFVYVHDESSPRFQMYFGLEVSRNLNCLFIMKIINVYE